MMLNKMVVGHRRLATMGQQVLLPRRARVPEHGKLVLVQGQGKLVPEHSEQVQGQGKLVPEHSEQVQGHGKLVPEHSEQVQGHGKLVLGHSELVLGHNELLAVVAVEELEGLGASLIFLKLCIDVSELFC